MVGEFIMSDILDGLREYWKVILGVIFVLIGFMVLLLSDSSKSDLEFQIAGLDAEIMELEKELNRNELTEEQLEPEAKIITESGAHALDMGSEMIEVQQMLTDAYKTIEPVVEFEDQAGLEEAKEAYTRMTNSTDYVHTWMLNGEWSMQLDTVATFKDADNVPVVFTMYLKDGSLAGIVRGQYNSQNDILDDVIVDYTVNGMNDAVDVGGA